MASSFGESLRRERELRRISLREISESTKINVRYLEALERNDFTHLPGGAFTKGFIRAYVKYIGADETEMINAYLYEISQKGDPPPDGSQVGRLADHYQVEIGDEEQRQSARRRNLILFGLILLLLAVAGGLWAYDTGWGTGDLFGWLENGSSS